LTYPWTHGDLRNRYWGFLSRGKLTGAMGWTPSVITIRVENVWVSLYLCILIKFRCVVLWHSNHFCSLCVSKRGSRVLSRTEIGRVVLFNTHFYLAPRWDISWAMSFLSSLYQLALYGMTFTFTFV
jgi:hypothetical protein